MRKKETRRLRERERRRSRNKRRRGKVKRGYCSGAGNGENVTDMKMGKRVNDPAEEPAKREMEWQRASLAKIPWRGKREEEAR